MTQQHSQNGSENGLTDKQARGGPSTQLEIYDGVVNPETTDGVASNLGTGYYTEDEQWQQVSSYRMGMFGDVAFGRGLYDRAVSDAKFELGRKGWSWYDEDRNQPFQEDGLDEDEIEADPAAKPRQQIREEGERIWNRLPEHEKLNVIQQFSGFSGNWTPPHWRMMEARHEASKSRDARTQDNLFGTRQERKVEEHRHSEGRGKRFGGRFTRGENR